MCVMLFQGPIFRYYGIVLQIKEFDYILTTVNIIYLSNI